MIRARQSYMSERPLIRRDPDRIVYILSNAGPHTSLDQMAWRKSHRYLIERDNQDAKSVQSFSHRNCPIQSAASVSANNLSRAAIRVGILQRR